jgi:hypothetical protein
VAVTHKHYQYYNQEYDFPESFVHTPQGNLTDSRGQPKTMPAEERYSVVFLSDLGSAGGVCFMINDSWCDCDNVQELKSFCSPNLEYLIKCRPYYLPRELSSVIVTAVYIHPIQADTTTTLNEFHWTLCKLETKYPEAVFIGARYFNK